MKAIRERGSDDKEFVELHMSLYEARVLRGFLGFVGGNPEGHRDIRPSKRRVADRIDSALAAEGVEDYDAGMGGSIHCSK